MRRLLVLLTPVALALSACGSPPVDLDDVPDDAAGHCVYDNQFSQLEECREYLGAAWDEQAATADCAAQDGTFSWGGGCGYDDELGRCVLNAGEDDVYRLVFPGDDDGQCASLQRGCELFGGGAFVPAAACGGVDLETGGAGSGGSVFLPPEQMCVDPLPGESAGQSEGGQVCTWSAISGCTEPGRNFSEYGSCDAVLTQRPYWPAPPAEPLAPEGDDPRLLDPSYVDELAWAKSEVEACGCICCHSERVAPNAAPSNWYVEAPGVWVDSFYPTGLALGAGWVDSTSFGAFAKHDNNGFEREATGLPSSNPERMKAFFEAELAYRGFTRDDFAGSEPFGGPLYAQRVYEPSDCVAPQGVDAGGEVSWSGGDARYLYVLEEGAANPGAPPNLDTPEGTLWRVDVAPDQDAVASGVAYGAVPTGATQRVPASGSAPALEHGRRYYLYVLADVGIPITRCLFTAGG
jgi:hypothetical protein